MTFSNFESSIESSQPIEVIRFFLGAETFEFTSSEDTVTVDSIDYAPTAIRRGKISQSPEDREAVVEFEVDGANEFARKYISVVPGSRARVTVRRVQRLDFPGPEVITLYEGYVISVRFGKNGHTAKIATQPIAAATARTIPRATYQGLCNNVLYDARCKVDSTDATWRLTNTILTSVAQTITVTGADGFIDGFFTGGFVEAFGGLDARLILSHVGTSLQLLLPFPSDVVNTEAIVFAGCDHLIGTCNTKFHTPEDVSSNVINYRGFHFVPTRDIFRNGIQ